MKFYFLSSPSFWGILQTVSLSSTRVLVSSLTQLLQTRVLGITLTNLLQHGPRCVRRPRRFLLPLSSLHFFPFFFLSIFSACILTIYLLQNCAFISARETVQQFLNASRIGNIDLLKSKFFCLFS